MAISLADKSALLRSNVKAFLHKTISYAADGVTFADVKARTDYSDRAEAFNGAGVMEQDISVKLLKADVAVKPSAIVRIELPKRPGKLFKPVNVGSDSTGDYWLFDLEPVSG